MDTALSGGMTIPQTNTRCELNSELQMAGRLCSNGGRDARLASRDVIVAGMELVDEQQGERRRRVGKLPLAEKDGDSQEKLCRFELRVRIAIPRCFFLLEPTTSVVHARVVERRHTQRVTPLLGFSRALIAERFFFVILMTICAAAHARLFSMNFLNVVPLLLDGEWLELRNCPSNTINRTAFEHVHRSRWLRYLRATIELLWLPRTCEGAVACETFKLV